MIVTVHRTQMGANGRVVIPAEVRRQLELEPGATLTVRVENGRIELESPDNLLRRIQAEWQSTAKGHSMVDELIAERRRAFNQEERELETWTNESS